jgi:hypothetical protein
VLSFVSQPGNAGDKIWFHCYNAETKQQFFQWKSPSLSCPQKTRQVRSNIKRVLVTYFDWGGWTVIIRNLFHQARQLTIAMCVVASRLKTFDEMAEQGLVDFYDNVLVHYVRAAIGVKK